VSLISHKLKTKHVTHTGDDGVDSIAVVYVDNLHGLATIGGYIASVAVVGDVYGNNQVVIAVYFTTRTEEYNKTGL
jgi:hypothetical protein